MRATRSRKISVPSRPVRQRIFCVALPGLNNEEYQVVIGNDTTSYIIDDLEPARNYSFYIVAYMPMGASRMSDQVSQHTLEDGKDSQHSSQ